MNNLHFMINKMPKNIEEELQKIQEVIKPVMKKRSRYMLISMPLIIISLFNLFLLMFNVNYNQETIVMLAGYALFAAIGISLYKEGKYQNEKIREISKQYMVKRVHKSRVLPDYRKKEYIQLIKQYPLLALNNFIDFLKEEENAWNTKSGN